ncbi:MAG TPA: DNA topoisomerase III [Opitutae bacterium]|nr:DNA topoisomerase III [Opitutae bacterium]|tara:strand:- start:2492 stop:4948 length:2457 start_codon:yes stop_codon:yes gene_type:complete
MKKLIIAEKPSVARDLAKALGKIPKKEDYFENEEWIIDSAIGHLVELYMPDDFDKKLKAWKIANLPIIPPKFELKPVATAKKKFQSLKKQLKRKDVDYVINACDAGREGELIFNYIHELSGSKLEVKRLWLLSMTDKSIREAFEQLRDSKQMQPLLDAARCRSESDWLIGINGTRAVTIKRNKASSRQVSTVGRVQTPTLSLVIEREHQIQNFKPQTYFSIRANFEITNGVYQGIYQKPDFKKDENNDRDRIDRIWDEDEAKLIYDAVEQASFCPVSETKKRSKQSSPRLYDLTTLQREANRLHSLPASRTLQIAQALYEKHKVITYPRTDSKALPEDYVSTCHDLLQRVSGDFQTFAQNVIQQNWINPSDKRIFNNKQISDHFAIIPTTTSPSKLDANESKIYNLILKRFIAVFYPPAEWDITTRITMVSNHSFKTEGKVLVAPSWLSIYGKDQGGEDSLPALSEENESKFLDSELISDETNPPPRYTEATLLSAMEGAGKLVDDEELAEALKEKGLGTPATRASTIEHLIKEKYLRREGTELFPSLKAEDLFQFLHAAGVEVLTSPAMTGEWEQKLRRIEEGKMSRNSFMEEISHLTREFVEKTTGFDETTASLKKTYLLSPLDKQPLFEGLNQYQNESGDFKISKNIAGRRLTVDEVGVLLKDKRVGPLDDFISKTGKRFSAMLKLEDDFKISFLFDNSKNEQEESVEKEMIKTAPVVSDCPICDGSIHQTDLSFLCSKNKRISEDGTCTFRLTRKLLDKDIPLEEFKKLVSEKKTGLIKGFISRRTKRRFDANLLLKDNGSIGFEFPPKKKKSA